VSEIVRTPQSFLRRATRQYLAGVHEWSAEIAVGEQLVRRLLRDQFPELPLTSLRLLAEGWDNAVWLVDERWAFRFPRRRIALPGVEREIAALPLLAPRLPAPVPLPAFVGRPSAPYPWPFFGAALLPGREADASAPAEQERAGLAEALGAFLRALHAPALAAAVDGDRALPVDFNGRADMSARVPKTREWLAAVETLGIWQSPPGLEALFADALDLPAPGSTVVVHGDLHFRHLLVDPKGGLAGVIDWGDVCRADPAVDLQLLWSFLPPDARAAFRRAYGPITDDQLLRARVLALCLCAALAAHAHHEGLGAVEREALDGLRRVAAG
jgi:aminoglycoside phosphotransferase (APT) family kinase protein